MSFKKPFTKSNVDYYLNELAKEYRKITRKNTIPVEIILVGGTSILVNYGFRESTYDMDAILQWKVLDEVIKNISIKFELERKWLNSDFTRTNSYSKNLVEHSVYYTCFQKVLNVRTIKDEYLIAMKMVSARVYKNDLSDIVGILMNQKDNVDQINIEKIEKAVLDLYGNTNIVNKDVWNIIERMLTNVSYQELYKSYRITEDLAHKQLLELRIINENDLSHEDINVFSEVFISNFDKYIS